MLFDLPVIVAIFMSLGLILVLDKFVRNLSLSILAGTFFLAFLSERSLKEFISIPLEKITDKENFYIGDEYDASQMRSDFLVEDYSKRTDEIPKQIYIDS